MRARRGLWAVYGLAAASVVAALAWMTDDLLALERAQQASRAGAAHQETLRLALWRMDSWLGPVIAAETNRLSPASASIVRSVYGVTSAGAIQYSRNGDPESERVVRSIDVAEARRLIDAAEARIRALVGLPLRAGEPAAQNEREYASRSKANYASQIAGQAARAGRGEEPGPLVPLWLRGDGRDPVLVFVQGGRRDESDAASEDGGCLAVFVADWAVLRRGLLDQIADVLPAALLRPVAAGERDAETGFVLASVPVALDAPRPPAPPLATLTPTRVTLGVAWLAVAGSLLAVGVALRRTVDLSDRRSRFASSVTHELRTPLTTFRLYSEMLADGMVTDPAQRQLYLDTLKSESSRLATLVENVLAYARVEEGRMPVRRERIAVADLLLRVTPPLDRRAQDAGLTLRVETGAAAAAAEVDADPDVVGQILFNLVDNAAKYGSISPGREIEVNGSVGRGLVRIEVRDHGPGIAPERIRAAFTPFERAGRPAGDAIPGVGLGLALSRALARDLGGDLDYEPAPGGGASFVLSLPTSVQARG